MYNVHVRVRVCFSFFSKEWTRNGSTVPIHIIEAVKSGEWWILHDALHIDAEVSFIYIVPDIYGGMVYG